MRTPSVLLALLLAGTPSDMAWAGPDDATAQELYYAGEAKYSAANYDGAIEDFTRALELNSSEGGAVNVRAALLFNLARSHDRQDAEVDPDITHLRTARAIYKRYLEEAGQGGEIDEAYDSVDEAADYLAKIEARLEEQESQAEEAPDAEGPRPEGDGETPRADPKADTGQDKKIGIAVLATGIAVTIGGAGMIGWGTTFENFALRKILEGRPDGYVLTAAQSAHVDDQIRFGQIWMGVGAGLAAGGLAAIGVGAWKLSKAKKSAQSDATAEDTASFVPAPMVGGGRAGVSLSGRF
jgi:tetratricopeptide (TPR) repeat protein